MVLTVIRSIVSDTINRSKQQQLIPLTEEANKLLAKVKAIGFESPDDFVFTKADGTRCSAHDISNAAYRIAAKIGIKKVSIHTIRRTISSRLNQMLPQKAVADLLGHTEFVNEYHYNYSLAENREKMEALAKVFPSVPKS